MIEVEATAIKVTGRKTGMVLRAPSDCPAGKMFCLGVFYGECQYARIGWVIPGSEWKSGEKVKVKCGYGED